MPAAKKRLAFLAALAASGVLVALALLSAGSGGKSGSMSRAPHPVWEEARWPFPADPWGPGLAFRCAATECGRDAVLYVRAKLGFCNCAAGIADDDDLDRMSDFDLIGSEASPLGDGRPLTVGAMKGRYRAYALNGRPGRTALSVALNERCDMIIAMAVLEQDWTTAAESVVLAFLSSPTILEFAAEKIGL